jgi:tRNA-specific adenosine deaminase 2
MSHTVTPFGPVPNRSYHEAFMRHAIDMAEFALASDETPVGCVFVHKGEIIGRGINGTNASLNVGTLDQWMLFSTPRCHRPNQRHPR